MGCANVSLADGRGTTRQDTSWAWAWNSRRRKEHGDHGGYHDGDIESIERIDILLLLRRLSDSPTVYSSCDCTFSCSVLDLYAKCPFHLALLRVYAHVLLIPPFVGVSPPTELSASDILRPN
jgi:hypothetical protein